MNIPDDMPVTENMCSPAAAAAGGAEPEAVEKYAAKYSASVDPFAAWQAKAAEERRASMGVHDRQGPPAARLGSASHGSAWLGLAWLGSACMARIAA
jgi:hypothetical protein